MSKRLSNDRVLTDLFVYQLVSRIAIVHNMTNHIARNLFFRHLESKVLPYLDAPVSTALEALLVVLIDAYAGGFHGVLVLHGFRMF